MIKLYKARSLLYRRQILQENIRWKALDEIYKIYMFLHRLDLNISEIFREFFEIREWCKGLHCVDLGESFPTNIFLQNLVPIQQKTSPKTSKFDTYLPPSPRS